MIEPRGFTRPVAVGFALLAVLARQTGHAGVPDSWTTPLEPFQITDELYYVGSEDLASYLVVTPAGNILINANLAGSPPQIRASVEKLGFHWTDIRILLNSQAHSDHIGGAAEVVRETQAANLVMEGDAGVIETGGASDFTAPSPPHKTSFTPVRVDRILRDGDTVSLGGITLTARKTAGHTRGTTTWTMRSHLPGEPTDRLRDVVIVGGTGFWSEYRFVDRPGQPASYPGIAEDFQRTFSGLRALRCDVFLGAHGGYFNLAAKLRQYPESGPRVFVDPDGYARFIDESEQAFEAALRRQRTAAAAH
jgi:metallo-beta-lactamase class B